MAALQQPSDDELNDAGVPATLTIRAPGSVGGLFSDGAVILDANTYTQVFAIAGALGIRIRALFDGDGTLSFAYRRPPPGGGGPSGGAGGGDCATAYSAALTPPHADVPVTGATEVLVNIVPGGEAYLAVTFNPTENGTCVFMDKLFQ